MASRAARQEPRPPDGSPDDGSWEGEAPAEPFLRSGRLSISEKNVEVIPQESDTDRKSIINQKSSDASLTILGF